MRSNVTFIDLFSGIGGFRIALERVGMRCVWSCDNDKSANTIYTRRFGAKNHYAGDIRKVNAETIPDHDILCAGFPCQSFSVAGRRAGFEDTRGTLFFEIYRIAKAKRPPILLLENVRGLLSNDKGKTFGIILQSLSDLGYLLEWQVLNSKHFGVPQSRQRVFIIGYLRGTSGREIFPITGKDSKNTKLTTGEMEKVTTVQTAHLHPSRWGDWVKEQIHSDTLDTTGSLGVMIGGSKAFLIHLAYTSLENAPRIYKNISPTLTKSGGGHHLPYLYDGIRVRRLTEVELERLQGLSDNWTRGLSYTRRANLIGNAVTVNVVEFLGERIMERIQ